MKPTLSINKGNIENKYTTLGLTELLTFLVDSDLFNITYHEDGVGGIKGPRAATLYYNDKKVYLDMWEYSLPTYSMEAYNFNFDLIIKIQQRPMTEDVFERACQRKNVFLNLTQEERLKYYQKIVPWTFFPSRMMKQFIGKEDELEKLPSERFGFFCGKTWKCRHHISNKLKDDGVELVGSNQGLRRGKPLTDAEYIDKMRKSKFGITLYGRGSFFSEAKNRREIDYMMLKKPLLMNYKPCYYDPLIEGKHFIYFDLNTDLKKLEELYNIDEIAENGYQWYKKNATPMGAANTFLQIMKDKFGEE